MRSERARWTKLSELYFSLGEEAARGGENRCNESDRLVRTAMRVENVSVITMHFAAYCTRMRWKIYFASFRKDPRITM